MHVTAKTTIISWNVRSLRSTAKQAYLHQHLKLHAPEIVCLQETQLDSSHKIRIPGYSWHRVDRPEGTGNGGGVAIGIKFGTKHTVAPWKNLQAMEAIAVDIIINKKMYRITSAYLPRYSRHFEEDMHTLFESGVENLVFGDLNAKHTAWNCIHANQTGRKLYDLQPIIGAFVYAPDDVTYHCASNSSTATIDILVTNAGLDHYELRTNRNLVSDHVAIELTFEHSCETFVMENFNYAEADWKKFTDNITIYADQLISPTNAMEIDIATEDFINMINRAQNEAVPKIKNRAFSLEYSPVTIKNIGEKRSLCRKLTRCRDHHDKMKIREEIKKSCIKIERMVYRDKIDAWNKMTLTLNKTPNKVWRLARNLRGRKSAMPPLNCENGQVAADNKTKANTLATNFESAHVPLTRTDAVFLEHDDEINRAVEEIRVSPLSEVDIPLITMEELRGNLRQLRPNKAPGPDGILNKLLKKLPVAALTKLLNLYNTCLKYSYWPSRWKIGRVVAIPKPGKPKENVTSYRPISLLDVCGKLFEKIIKCRLTAHVEANNCLNPEQFGFRSGHSAPQQALRVVHEIRKMKQNRKSTGVLMLDIAKAFDTVWHNGLIFKLNEINTPTYITKILQHWLTNRKFYVVIGEATSSRRNVPAGVPQGSSLSPLLYALFVADLPTPTDCTMAIYADDTALLAHSVQARGIMTRLEKGFATVERFFLKWKIKINSTKTEFLFVPFDGKKRRMPQAPLNLKDDVEIEHQAVTRYLGIFIDKKLLFKHHIEQAKMKSVAAFRAIYGLLARNSGLSRKCKRQLFLSIIRPIMLYGAEIWRSAAKTNLKPLQIVQSGCLKTILRLRRRHPTKSVHDLANIPLINDYIVHMHQNMKRRCALAESPFVRDLENA